MDSSILLTLNKWCFAVTCLLDTPTNAPRLICFIYKRSIDTIFSVSMHCKMAPKYQSWYDQLEFMKNIILCIKYPHLGLVVLYRMFPLIICLILMNYLMEFYFIGFVNAHLPGCFCPWTFRLNIGLNTSPSDSFVSYLNSHLGYSAGEFQALQLIVLAVFGAVD